MAPRTAARSKTTVTKKPISRPVSRPSAQQSKSRTNNKQPTTSRVAPKPTGVSKPGPPLQPATSSKRKEGTDGAGKQQKKKGTVQIYEDEDNDSSDREVEEQEPVSEYVLRNKTRNISLAVIEKKWRPMAPEVQERVKEILESVERPIVASFRTEKKRREGQEVLGKAVRRLRQSVIKLPVPASTKDLHFNLEKLSEETRIMQEKLEPTLRFNAVLEATMEKERKQLEQDEAQLAELKKSAQHQESLRRQRAKKIHPLLRPPQKDQDTDMEDMPEDIHMVIKGPSLRSTFDLASDSQTSGLSNELKRHLTTMQTNRSQLEGLAEWTRRGQMAVEEVLRKAGKRTEEGLVQ